MESAMEKTSNSSELSFGTERIVGEFLAFRLPDPWRGGGTSELLSYERAAIESIDNVLFALLNDCAVSSLPK